MKYLFFIFVLMFSNLAYSAPVKKVTGTIDKIQLMNTNYQSYSTNGKAIAFIHMSELPPSCGNSGNFRRVAITSDHPAFNVVVSAALAAKAANQQVEMHYLEECTLWNSNAWDFAMFMGL